MAIIYVCTFYGQGSLWKRFDVHNSGFGLLHSNECHWLVPYTFTCED